MHNGSGEAVETEWGRRGDDGNEEGWVAAMRNHSNVSSANGNSFEFSPSNNEQLQHLGIVRVLPGDSERLKQSLIEKRTQQIGTWVQRTLALTSRHLLVAKPDAVAVSEDIPLHEISLVRRIADSDTGMQQATSTRSVPLTEHAAKLRGLAELESLALAFEVHTRLDGLTGGRHFLFRASSLDECREYCPWVQAIERARQEAIKEVVLRHEKTGTRIKRWMKTVYDSNITQTVVASIIMISFAVNLVKAELVPYVSPSSVSVTCLAVAPADPFVWMTAAPSGSEEQSQTDMIFTWIDLGFTIIFALELLWNLCANFFRPFISDAWNLFDTFVVIISILSIAFQGSGSFNLLRLFRVFRVIRIFRRLQSLKQIINALTASLIPVGNSFLVMGLITSIYAVLGVNVLSDIDSYHFGKFSTSFFAMLQILVGFGEPIVVPLWETEHGIDAVVGAFFMSYVIIAGLVLINIVIAVLLDNFITSVASDNAEARQEGEHSHYSHWGNNIGPMDSLLATLVHYSTAFDLDARLRAIFEALDVDESGTLSFSEIKYGLSRLNFHPRIAISEDDFEFITNHKRLCDEKDEIGPEAFKTMMIMQLEEYTQRKMALVAEAVQDSPEQQALFALMMAVRQFGVRMDAMWLEHRQMQTRMHRGSPGRRWRKGRAALRPAVRVPGKRGPRSSESEGSPDPVSSSRRMLSPVEVDGAALTSPRKEAPAGDGGGGGGDDRRQQPAEEPGEGDSGAARAQGEEATDPLRSSSATISELLTDLEAARSPRAAPGARPEPVEESPAAIRVEAVGRLPHQPESGSPSAREVGWGAGAAEEGLGEGSAAQRGEPRGKLRRADTDSLLSDAGTPPPLPSSLPPSLGRETAAAASPAKPLGFA